MVAKRECVPVGEREAGGKRGELGRKDGVVSRKGPGRNNSSLQKLHHRLPGCQGLQSSTHHNSSGIRLQGRDKIRANAKEVKDFKSGKFLWRNM